MRVKHILLLFSSGFLLLAGAPSVAQTSGQQTQSSDQANGTETVVVTAQKRKENLQDVPVPVAVIGGQTLLNNHELTFQDYYNTVPGLSIGESGHGGEVRAAIRGIDTGAGLDPTTSVTIDDVPVTGVLPQAGSQDIPDVDPNDIERVEVLRGPQGALYGASSMGGLIRYITKDPSGDQFSGNLTAGTSFVQNGAEPGYEFRVSTNVPLTDNLAIRASGFTRQDPGYIDNLFGGIKGINEDHAGGGRFAAMWTPSNWLSVKISALYQDTKYDGASDVGIGLGDLQQNYPPGVGESDRKAETYSAIVTAKIGGIDLTSVTGYSINSEKDTFDFTTDFGSLAQSIFGVPYDPVFEKVTGNIFSDELRLSGSAGDSIDWLV
ncbi:MAG TPA: TonB-dependent receptor plug domain-containing protein, partial [Rhizomicrobium sp.]|nr:TonB-dependent receptor plug domain-containing protein [Rhizomicrobium sp.]